MASDKDVTKKVSSDDAAEGKNDNAGDCPFLLAVFGKSGTGKSSLCNQIAGQKDRFPVGHGLSCATKSCEEEKVQRFGRSFKVMDTPGEGDMKVITQAVKKAGVEAQGKVCIVFCVRCDSRYTQEDHSIYLELKKCWGKDFKDRLVVAFSHGDKLSHDTYEENFQTTSATEHAQTTETKNLKQSREKLNEDEETMPKIVDSNNSLLQSIANYGEQSVSTSKQDNFQLSQSINLCTKQGLVAEASANETATVETRAEASFQPSGEKKSVAKTEKDTEDESWVVVGKQEKSKEEKKLQQMLSVAWPQLQVLTEDKNKFILFSNQRQDTVIFELIKLAETMKSSPESSSVYSIPGLAEIKSYALHFLNNYINKGT